MFILTHLTFVLTDNLSSFQLKSDDAETFSALHVQPLLKPVNIVYIVVVHAGKWIGG
jgi:hypothetical protein